MRNAINEGLVRFRQREMQKMGERRRLGNAVVESQRSPRKPVIAPLLAFAGVVLSRLGNALQERYRRAPDMPLLIDEPVHERQ